MKKDVESLKQKLGDDFDSFVEKINHAGKIASDAGFSFAQMVKGFENFGKMKFTVKDYQNRK